MILESRPASLSAWLDGLERRNRDSIVLGLDRVRTVRDRLRLDPAFPVITVGGTNGKGSTCACLEAILLAAGYRPGCYTSPHLLRYNERVRIGGLEAGDDDLCEALDIVEAARQDTPLTYFEQGTLAAMYLFQRAGVDAAILEVGLGGRLDAVNAWDADCAVITSVDLDHQSFLGNDREQIGFEKAGILRRNCPAICGDEEPPASLLAHARQVGANLLCLGKEITLTRGPDDWLCRIADQPLPALPRPAMAGAHQYANAACALGAMVVLRQRLPVSLNAMRLGIAAARQPGRFQVVGREPLRILDVAHNPHAARTLAANLADLPPTGEIRAVFSLLADKDLEGVVGAVKNRVKTWHVAGLQVPRGLDTTTLQTRISAMGCVVTGHDSIAEAWRSACRLAEPADTILAFGSFHTVAEALQATSGENSIHD